MNGLQKSLTKISEASRQDDEQISLRELVMAWARDRETSEPRYILELGPERRGKNSGCVCPSCGAPLTAVNAAKKEFVVRPHFRHPSGIEKQSCSIVAARFALMKELQNDGWIRLPQLNRKVGAIGLSGQSYETWINVPAQKFRVQDIDFRDPARALLTLENGKQLEISLTGSATISASDGLIASVTLNIDDPEISVLPPEEIRKRLTLMPDWFCWQSHWNDPRLNEQANQSLERQMLDALDAPPPDLDLREVPKELHRETVLHFMAKQILMDAKRIRVPAIHLEVTQVTPSGKAISQSWEKPESALSLDDVRLESRLNRLIPDVTCMVQEEAGDTASRLRIEITVTNPIDKEREKRISEAGEATLEVDLSHTGGRLTYSQFREFLINETAIKRWVYHPLAARAEQQLWQALEREVLCHQQEIERNLQQLKVLNQKKQEEVLSIPPQVIARDLLQSVIDYMNPSESGWGAHAGYADGEVEELAKQSISRYAHMLEAHGYPGADSYDMINKTGYLPRLLSLKHDRGIGYDVETGFEVLNSIWQSGASKRTNIPLYLAASRRWGIFLTEKQKKSLSVWRRVAIGSIKKGEPTYLRVPTYDRLLALLFPELEPDLAITSREALRQFVDSDPPWRPTNDGYLQGAELDRWLREHPDVAPYWEHLRK
jgi:hypothetical protein